MIDFFNNLTEVMQGQVIVGAITLTASIIGIVGTILVTNIQMRHQRKQKEREQAFELRKEIYLQSIDEYSKHMQALVSSIVNVEMNGLASSTYYKLGLAASKNTLTAIKEYQVFLNEITYLITSDFINVATPIKKSIMLEQNNYDTYSEQAGQSARLLGEVFGRLGINQEVNESYPEILQNEVVIRQGLAEEANRKIVAQNNDLAGRQLNALYFLLQNSEELQNRYYAILHSIRKELGMPTDKAHFDAWSQSSLDFLEKTIAEYEKYLPQVNDSTNESS